MSQKTELKIYKKNIFFFRNIIKLSYFILLTLFGLICYSVIVKNNIAEAFILALVGFILSSIIVIIKNKIEQIKIDFSSSLTAQ